tara:strand:+ start:566 stop:1201 length:636 start_codon:yes stop_codon:yes gene_type:complete
MKKKVLVIGSGMDVTEKKRGKLLNNLFDDIFIFKYQILYTEQFKDYIGNPTILIAPGLEWKKESYQELLKSEDKQDWIDWHDDKVLEQRRNTIYESIEKSTIKEVWLNSLNSTDYFYSFKQLPNIKTKYIDYPESTNTGLSLIFYLIENNYEIYVMGFDGHQKGIHYYPEPFESFKPNFGFTDEVVFKLLEWKSEGKVTHVDKLISSVSKS